MHYVREGGNFHIIRWAIRIILLTGQDFRSTSTPFFHVTLLIRGEGRELTAIRGERGEFTAIRGERGEFTAIRGEFTAIRGERKEFTAIREGSSQLLEGREGSGL